MKHIKKIVFFSSLFLIVCMFTVLNNYADRDLWHRLAVGTIFFQTGGVLNQDIFAYTLTKPNWIDHEWGSGVVFYFISHYFGDPGLMTLKIILLFSVLAVIYRIHRLISPESGNYRIIYYVLTLTALYPGFGSTIRCQAFTYLFFTLWIYLLERVRRGENRLIWIFPVTTILWANLHGGFLSGFGIVFLYALGELLNRKNPLKYLLILLLIIPVTLINPYGINYWYYMIEAATMPRPYITEWAPINLFAPISDWTGLKILLPVYAFGYIYSLFKKIKIDWTEVLLVIVTLVLTLRHERQAIFLVIILAIFGYKHFYNAIGNIFRSSINKVNGLLSEKQVKKINFAREAFVFLVIVVLSVNAVYVTPATVIVDNASYPTRAVEFIKLNKLKGNLLLPFNWGSYALWKLYPQCLISIDGRYEEVYPNKTYSDNTDFIFHNKGWQNILEKYHHDIIMVEVNSATYKELKTSKNWRQVYQDNVSAIFVPSSNKQRKWSLPSSNRDYSKDKYSNTIYLGDSEIYVNNRSL